MKKFYKMETVIEVNERQMQKLKKLKETLDNGWNEIQLIQFATMQEQEKIIDFWIEQVEKAINSGKLKELMSKLEGVKKW